MLFQILHATEPPSAFSAWKRTLARVHPHPMRTQTFQLRERLVAIGTMKRFLAVVNQPMSIQVFSVHERLVAVRTLVRLFPRVDVPVELQVAPMRE